jgi:threonine-phosphate decarboxylase
MKHGANIYKYAKKLECRPKEIIDFSSNINAYHGKSKTLPTNDMIVKYADTKQRSLKKTIATKYQLKKSQIALYNGATSAIFELLATLKQKQITLYAPLYGEYEKAISKDKIIHKINRATHLYQKPKKNSIVIFVNPSTPDGKYYNLTKLIALWKKQKCTIILDESFLEFEDLPSFRDEIKHYKKLYIIHSFSKFYSCAGVRIGAIFSNKKNIKRLTIPLWNLSSFDVAFLEERLNDKNFVKKSRQQHKKNKKELRSILIESKQFDKVISSDSNFILTKSNNAQMLFKKLLAHKVLLRSCESFDFLDTSYLRFAVKDSDAHQYLKKVLSE